MDELVTVVCKQAFTIMDLNISAEPGQQVKVPESRVKALLSSDLIWNINLEQDKGDDYGTDD